VNGGEVPSIREMTGGGDPKKSSVGPGIVEGPTGKKESEKKRRASTGVGETRFFNPEGEAMAGGVPGKEQKIDWVGNRR